MTRRTRRRLSWALAFATFVPAGLAMAGTIPWEWTGLGIFVALNALRIFVVEP